MSSESMLRLALLVMLLVFMPIGVYHRIKSQTGERLRRRDEGLVIMIGLRLGGLAVWLGMLAWLIDPRVMDWARVDLPVWLRWAGLPTGILAAAWMSWMFRTLGANLTDTVTVRTGATLVTGGPYRWVRHPLYLGAAMMVVSISLLTANAYFAVGGALVIVFLLLRSKTEEAQLEERFGEAYRAYRTRTGFLLPRLR